MISDEAVEAAARAQFEKWHPEKKWDDRPDIQRIFRRDALVSLEAAAPYIAAQVWDEAAASIIDEHGNPIQPTNINNPYRSQA
jgi:hypothetical protein